MSNSIRNLIFLIVFLLLVSTLIWWLWSGSDEPDTLPGLVEQNAPVSTEASQAPINMEAVEILYDDNGLTIETLFNQPVNLTLTERPVRNVEVYDGILTYQEQVEGNWNFRSYNLGQYIEENLK